MLRRHPVRALVAAGLALTAVAAAVVWVVLFSTLLALRDVRVEGTSPSTAAQIQRLVTLPPDVPLARIDLDSVADEVGTIPSVRGVSVSRQWPHTLLVQVVQRTPVALLATSAGERAVDASGALFPVPAGHAAGLPRLVLGPHPTAGALPEAAAVAAALPKPIAVRVNVVHASTMDSITLHLRSGDLVRWGNAADSSEKGRVLEALLHRPARYYDVSVPAQPTTSQIAAPY
jgi:cell division protein FtsQ